MSFFKNQYYLSPEIFQKEQEIFFKQENIYFGQEALVPHLGDFYVLNDLNNAWVLTRAKEGIQVLRNICRHRQATLLEGRGNTRKIVCPLHYWSYDLDGESFRSPGFEDGAVKSLYREENIQIYNGFIFKGFENTLAELKNIEILTQFDFSEYQFLQANEMQYGFGWKEYIDVFLDVNHVNFIHPGLKSFVDCNNLKWDFGDTYSIQKVALNPKFRESPDTRFQKYVKTYQHYFPGYPFEFGAIWVLLYPNITMDIFQNFFSIAVTMPNDLNTCTVYERVYAHQSIVDKTDLIEAFMEAFDQIEVEDADIMYRTRQGRVNLYKMGMEDAGPYQSLTEAGMRYFHKYLINSLQILKND